jgi:NAD(P)-dependent dehydrogenase (short-subunit alcohol dehydrogenase family)
MTTSLFDLSGRCALVTGGSKGLGKAMARALAEAGADVMIASRHEAELKTASDELHATAPGKVHYLVSDLSQREAASQLAQRATSAMGKVDILVNNAGTNIPQAIDEVDDDAWDRLLELNLSSCMALSRAVAPGMKGRRWGRIIHISSIMGLASKSGRSAYSATKSALIGMARASALDLGPSGITVNCIAPGPFLTDLPRQFFSAEQIEAVAARTALGRWGEPHELSGPVLLLASDAGAYITGATLVVDGGALCATM